MAEADDVAVQAIHTSEPATQAPTGGLATGAQTMTEALAEMADEGYDRQFQVTAEAAIRCLTCRQTITDDDLDGDDVVRLEGASDPADMAVLVRVSCGHCQARGVLVLRYGPEASAEEATVLRGLDRAAPR